MHELTVLGIRFELKPHGMDEVPEGVIQRLAYVQFPESSLLKLARWRNDGWTDASTYQPFEQRPERWYSLELPPCPTS